MRLTTTDRLLRERGETAELAKVTGKSRRRRQRVFAKFKQQDAVGNMLTAKSIAAMTAHERSL